MKAPELSELISESYPNFNNLQNNNNITKTEEYINELKNRIEELEQENTLQIGQNINLKKEYEEIIDEKQLMNNKIWIWK